MRAVDLHPEDLLEREADGDLTAAEFDRLRAHLAACAVCRFERLARRDVGAEVDYAEEVDVQRLLATVLTPEALRHPDAPAKVARFGPQRSRVALLAAAMVCVASVAAAAGYTELRERASGQRQAIEAPHEGPSSVTARPHKGAKPGNAGGAHGVGLGLGASDLPSEEPTRAASPRNDLAFLSPSAEPGVAPGSQVVANVDPVLFHRSDRPEPTSSRGAAPTRSATSSSEAEAPVGPAALFERANEARHAGDRTVAIRGYRALLAQYPGSPEAHEALAALGKILLDGGDAAGAVRCFDDYLSRGGALRQDVMADRAVGLQRLGRSNDEAVAWSALLSSYPASVHGERARRRLAELEKR